GGQQLMPNTPTYSPTGKGDFARYDFYSTEDGKIRSMGGIYSNVNTQPYSMRGARLYTGSYNSGVISWSGDSIIPPVTYKSANTPNLFSEPRMTWNEAGNVGYVWFIGCRSGATGANAGYQPIVFKTVNS